MRIAISDMVTVTAQNVTAKDGNRGNLVRIKQIDGWTYAVQTVGGSMHAIDQSRAMFIERMVDRYEDLIDQAFTDQQDALLAETN